MSAEYAQELLTLLRRSIYLLIGLFLIFLVLSPLLVQILVKRGHYYLFGVMDAFEFFFSIAGKLALLVGIPIIITWFYVWASDAFLPEERRWVKKIGLVSVILFFIGAGIGFLVFPRVVGIAWWIAGLYGADLLISMREIVDLALMMVILTGVVFQFPVLMYFMIRTGIVSRTWFSENRHIAYGVFFILSMFITPGDMLFTDLVLTAFFAILYEATLLVTRHKA